MTTAGAAVIAGALAFLLAPSADAVADSAVPKSGSYTVDVRLELPNVQNTGARKFVTLCVSARDQETYGLAVLSNNNPFSACPIRNVRRKGGTLMFDIVCKGPNAPRATATFRLEAERFRGRIAMNMGGKNMTMVETQDGRRVGRCKSRD